MKDSLDQIGLQAQQNRIISDEPMTKHSLIPLNIASKTEDINLYQPENCGHVLVAEPRPDAPSLRDSQKNFKLRIGGSQPSFDMKFDYSKESGNEYLIGRQSPSIKSKHFVERPLLEESKENVVGSSSTSGQGKSRRGTSESTEEKRKISKKAILENKLKLELGKMDEQVKPEPTGFKAKLHKKMRKQRAKDDKQATTRPGQYNQIPSTVSVQNADLYNPAYVGHAPNLHYGQFQAPFGHPGMYMNQLPVKEGKFGCN